MKTLALMVGVVGLFVAWQLWNEKPNTEPTLTAPQKYFPIVKTKKGNELRAVTIERRDIDGFVVTSQNKILKIFNKELDSQSYVAFCAAIPMVSTRPTPFPSRLNEPARYMPKTSVDDGKSGNRWEFWR